MLHHVSVRTADIHRSITFYELLGFEVKERFTTGYTLACWLEGLGGRLELIEIPEPKPAPDAFGDEHYTGYYHASFDLTAIASSLVPWLETIKTKFNHQGWPLKILLSPQQQIIGSKVYEVLFLGDPDGLPLEFIRLMSEENP